MRLFTCFNSMLDGGRLLSPRSGPFTHAKETWHPLYFVSNVLQVLALQNHNRAMYTNIKNLELFHQPTLIHNFLYSLTICCYTIILHMFSALTCPSAGRKIVFTQHLVSALNQCTVQTFTESEDTRCCVNTIFPPEDGHVNARNMSRIIV